MAALGEWRFGNGRGCEHFVYVTISTGIGGGIVVDKKLLLGRNGMAGEVGHMTILARRANLLLRKSRLVVSARTWGCSIRTSVERSLSARCRRSAM